MGTTLRAELSEKNPYWIEKHRYYELKHFCLQYPILRICFAVGWEHTINFYQSNKEKI